MFSLVLSSVLWHIEPVSAATFTNPIAQTGHDPWVILHEGYYYYSYSLPGPMDRIFVNKAKRLQDIGVAPRVTVWKSPNGTSYSQMIYAPELHYLDGKWYIYFAATDENSLRAKVNHRMYVIEGNTQDPQGSYTFKGQLKPTTDRRAIDGTVLVTDKGQKYFIWSGWEAASPPRPYLQSLYIAQMSNPWTISGDRHLLSAATYDWESVPFEGNMVYVNEGPEVLKKNDKIHIIYSASATLSVTYCLGQLTYTSGDLLDAASWRKKPTPVFSKTADIYGPGHASFTKSPDGTEDWIVYHFMKNTEWDSPCQVSAQKFTWNQNDEPVFGSPVALGVPIQEPSGTGQISAGGPNTLIIAASAVAAAVALAGFAAFRRLRRKTAA
ncbi:MAG: glycoside hydrolase family 43 protein [archaeon]